MNIKKILCPVDYSEFSQSANAFASTLASSNEGELVYLHVVDTSIPYAGYGLGNLDQEEQQELKRLMDEFKPSIKSLGEKAVFSLEAILTALLNVFSSPIKIHP